MTDPTQLRSLEAQLEQELSVIRSDRFHRLGANEFGMPGLHAVESVGPFVELMQLGPFITIHDSIIEKGLGIGHHPHRFNERLFYILQGQIKHDDAMNGITGQMSAGDLARLTEGERGMLHQEWSGRTDIDAHAFILVYAPDIEPPLPVAAFDTLRADGRVRAVEAEGVETHQLIGGESAYRANSSRVATFFDTTMAAGSAFDHAMPADAGLIVYPLQGAIRLPEVDDVLRGGGIGSQQGPDGVGVAWSAGDAESVRIEAVGGPARLLRVGFRRGDDDVVLHQPWSRR